jgi:hypothetical protein
VSQENVEVVAQAYEALRDSGVDAFSAYWADDIEWYTMRSQWFGRGAGRAYLQELRDLFDVVAQGHAGAIGSRFSHESVLINYPFPKIIANRAFHLLVRLVLRRRIRDVSNNLKLYRAEILKELEITRPDFGANAETGLGPLLAGYDIKEVPISWIKRTEDMGASDFRILRFAPSYLRAVVGLLRTAPRKRKAREPSS